MLKTLLFVSRIQYLLLDKKKKISHLKFLEGIMGETEGPLEVSEATNHLKPQ